MELWNEYEGRTIAGSFPLHTLLRPEGRSAFFTTNTPSGTSTVIRLIESHYDDDEILARWTAVSALQQQYLLTMTHTGHTIMDETALVYAVMEPTDADLGQILQERPLNPTETHQVATSVVGALLALKSIGMVHDHIQPMNVLAVGETVKLRSDCIRYAPDGPEGEAARARDVHDLCILLLQSLTLRKTLETTGTYSAALPAPFREIVANGLDGRWGLSEIAASLARSAAVSAPKATPAASPTPNRAPAQPSPARPEPVRPEPAVSGAAVVAPAGQPTPSSTSPGAATNPAHAPNGAAPEKPAGPAERVASAPKPALQTSPVPSSLQKDAPPTQKPASAPAAAPSVVSAEPPVAPMFNPGRTRRDTPQPAPRDPRLARATIAAMVLFVLFIVAWRLTRHTASPRAKEQPGAEQQVSAPQAASTAETAQPSSTASAVAAAPGQVRSEPAASPAAQPWHVVAFTYNKQAQAQAKADVLSKQHPGLHVEVFTPNGRAPFLVTVGGAMSRAEAFALRARLRGRGFPRDLYAQNYGDHTGAHPAEHRRGRHQR